MNQTKIFIFFLLINQCVFSQFIGGLPLAKKNFKIPSTISFNASSDFFLVSVYDADYLPYTLPVSVASTTSIAADGINETVAINYQGTIPVLGLSIKIPVTTTGSGVLPRFAIKTTVLSDYAEDGVARSIVLSWEQQNYTGVTNFIDAKISAVEGVFNLKKLDINSGVGSDFLGITIGTFQFPGSSSGALVTLNLRLMSGIPDKMFGIADNAGNASTHLMLYTPVLGENGNIWLNNNLGAHYSNYNHSNFNPINQAQSNSDFLAYGSLFQWGRKPDGHELYTFTSGTTVSPVYPNVTVKSDNPIHASYIRGFTDWRVTADTTLWPLETSPNNPCPLGFKVPSSSQLQGVLFPSVGASTYNTLVSFPFTGQFFYNQAAVTNMNISSVAWSSTPSGASATSVGNGGSGTSARSNAYSVRCIKN